MPLEYILVLSFFVLGAGLIGILIRRETGALFLSVIMMTVSLLTAFTGFTLFWKNHEGITAIFVVLILWLVQTVTTLNVVRLKKS